MDVLAGSERYLLAALAAGASGCVTATANADPASICALYDARHSPHAGALQEKVTAARLALEAFPMIPALKELPADRTGDGRWRNLRPPLTALDAAQREALHAQRRTAAAP